MIWQRAWIKVFVLLALPGRKEETIDDPRLPDVYVAGGRELSRIAGQDPGVVRQVIVQPEVGPLRIHQRDAITLYGVATEGLLHPEHRLEAANPAIQAAEGLRAVISLNPIALSMVSAREL